MKYKVITFLLLCLSFSAFAQTETATEGNFFNNSAVIGGVIGGIVGAVVATYVVKKRKN